VCRAVRLIELMRLIDDRDWTIEALAERLGVSVSTIHRDLWAIQGAPLYYPLMVEHVVRRMRGNE